MIIFLAGIHGVGKTFLGPPAAENLKITYATASSLIKKELDGQQTWGIDKRTAKIDSNQELLISAVAKLKKKINYILLLDGHFVLKNKEGELITLSVDVFQRLEISCIILLETSSSKIIERLKQRGINQTQEEITEIAEAELNAAENISHSLQIPLVKLFEPTLEQLKINILHLNEQIQALK